VAFCQGDGSPLVRACFSPDGRSVAAVGFGGAVQVWDNASGLADRTFRGQDGWCYGLAFRPDGRCLASAAEDGTIKVWAADLEQEAQTHGAQSGSVTCLAFSPDGASLAFGSSNWFGRAAKTLAGVLGPSGLEIPPLTADVRGIAYHPDGKRLVLGDEGKNVTCWELDPLKQS